MKIKLIVLGCSCLLNFALIFLLGFHVINLPGWATNILGAWMIVNTLFNFIFFNKIRKL